MPCGHCPPQRPLRFPPIPMMVGNYAYREGLRAICRVVIVANGRLITPYFGSGTVRSCEMWSMGCLTWLALLQRWGSEKKVAPRVRSTGVNLNLGHAQQSSSCERLLPSCVGCGAPNLEAKNIRHQDCGGHVRYSSRDASRRSL